MKKNHLPPMSNKIFHESKETKKIKALERYFDIEYFEDDFGNGIYIKNTRIRNDSIGFRPLADESSGNNITHLPKPNDGEKVVKGG